MRRTLKQTIGGILWFSLFILIYTAFFIAMYCWMIYNTVSGGVSLWEWLYSLLVNYIPILVLGFGIVAVCRYTLRFKKLGHKIIVDILALAAMLIIVNYGFMLITGMPFNWGGSIFNGMMVTLGVEFWLLTRQKEKALIRENLLTRENMSMRYEVQKAYVNPHFLYNTLDMLSALIEDDKKEESLDFIMRLSAYYRTMTRKINMPVTTLSEEINMVRNYLEIVKYHHENALTFNVECSFEKDPTMVPFSLQLLVENVLKHNKVTSKEPVNILVSVKDSGVTVSNNCIPKIAARQKGTGLGLAYLKNIYSYYGKNIIIDKTPAKFTVTLPSLAYKVAT